MKRSFFFRIVIITFLLLISGTWQTHAQFSLNQRYLTPDGSFLFNYPDGWAIHDDGAGTVLVASNSAVLEKTVSELAGGEVLLQIMSPAMTENLLLTDPGITPDEALNALLASLSSSLTPQNTASLELAGKQAARANVSTGDSEILVLTVQAGEGGISLLLGFTRIGERINAEAVMYAIAETMQYTRPALDRSTLQPITVENGVRISPLAILGGHSTGIRALNFSADGSQLVTGDSDGLIRIWDVASALPISKTEMERPFSSGPVFSPAGNQLLFGGVEGTVWLWDLANQAVSLDFEPMSDVVWALAFSPDGTKIAGGSEDLTARLWDAATGEEILIFSGHLDGLTDVAFSPDGTRLATTSWDATVRIWDVATGEQLLLLPGPQGGLISVAFSPDGSRVAAGARNGTLRIWDAVSGVEQLIMQAEPNNQPITAVTFNSDGTVIAAAVQDTTVRLWETNFGAPLATLNGPNSTNDLAFSPDGTLLAGANDAGVLIVWGVR